jgi:hypothetical protein
MVGMSSCPPPRVPPSVGRPIRAVACRCASAALLAVLWTSGSHAQPLSAPPPLPDRAAAPGTAQPDEAPTEFPEPTAARRPADQTRIEQTRRGNRIVEVHVTPAGTTYSYTMINRDASRPASPQEPYAGLSAPRFLKFDF